jgi:hypothetical protein
MDNFVRKTKEEIFVHFKRRLKERYNLDITENEYKNLTIKEVYYKLNSNRSFCKIVINNTDVNVIWDNDVRLFRTCLPYDLDILPVPKIMRGSVDLYKFNEFVNNKIKEANSNTELFYLDSKNLFTENKIEIASIISLIKKCKYLDFNDMKTKVALTLLIAKHSYNEIIDYSVNK